MTPPSPTLACGVDAPDLADRLKAATSGLHRVVERRPFMGKLLRGELPRARYALLMHNLQALYGALESALLQHAEHPSLAPLRLAGLWRTPALVADQSVIERPGDEPPCLVPAMRDYVDRITGLSQRAPDLLVAHAYVRYLGDLNGGQALQRVVARAYGLQDGLGTRFYDFGPRNVQQQLIEDFRAALRSVGARAAQPQTVVDEAVSAFERHARLFDELEAWA